MKKILKHCDLWKDPDPPPDISSTLVDTGQEFIEEVTYDSDFFDVIA